MRLEADEKIQRIAVELPASIPVFDHYGIRFCGDPGPTLAEACRKAGASPSEVLESLRGLVRREDGNREDWDHAPLPALVRYILEHHHTFETRQIETILGLFQRVVEKHGENHPELAELSDRFGRLAADLKNHMHREETDVFPAFCGEVAPGSAEKARQRIATRLAPLLLQLEHEHRHHRGEWLKIRSLAGDFIPPEDACTGYRALFQALAQLEQYQRDHVLKEDGILFKRIKAMAN